MGEEGRLREYREGKGEGGKGGRGRRRGKITSGEGWGGGDDGSKGGGMREVEMVDRVLGKVGER